MRAIFKLGLILICFSVFFFGLRIYGGVVGYNISTLISDLGGVTYLYSTVATIFAMFAAFVVVSESQDWNTLSAASKDEVRDLNEMLLWSKKLSSKTAEKYSFAIQRYLEIVIEREWRSLERGLTPPEIDPVLSHFHDLLVVASEESPEIGAHLFASFNNLLNHRAIRVEYSWQPLPTILKFTVFAVATAVMGLSLLIGVKNMGLDYLFMLCIVTLGSVILIVIDDLDNPLRPGEWCLTVENHQRLLSGIYNSAHPVSARIID